jgi:deoxycytidine triphosphate deaminase
VSEYWEKPDNLVLAQEYWRDPLPDVEAMLSSDLIAYYNEVVATPGMIDPFNVDNLKPAAYELTLGPNYLLEGREGILTREEPWLALPPNSVVFVSMQERLVLPHYIVARFDLAIEFIYQGILLGTGPQVDPGFQGVLSCPLHNISNAPVHLQLGYPFAKIDFAKSRGLAAARAAGYLDEIETEEDLYVAAAASKLLGEDGKPVKLFNKNENRWRQPIYSTSYAGQKRVKSSLSELQDNITAFAGEIDAFDEEIRRVRRFGYAGAIAIVLAVVTIVITVAQLDRSYVDAKVGSVEKTQASASGQPKSSAAVSRLQAEVSRLRRQVAKLTAELRHPRG